MFDYDAELAAYHERLREALAVRADDRILDVGCGTGQTTRDAARVAARGTALGIDVSGPMLERARQQASTEGLDNVEFVRADAQTHALPPEWFSLAVSRFGTMFFSDTVAAFTNIGGALCPGARFVQLVWQPGDRQEWHAVIQAALSGRPVAPSTGDAFDGPFALGDPEAMTRDLTAAGFTAVEVVDVCEPVYYGPNAARAGAAVLELWTAKDAIAGMDAVTSRRTVDRLTAALEAYDTGAGVWFDSRAWLVIARRP